MQRKLNQREGEVKKLHQRVTYLKAQLVALYRGFQWLLRNTRRAFTLLSWLGTGQFTRAARATLPYYQQYVPWRVKQIIPDKMRHMVERWIVDIKQSHSCRLYHIPDIRIATTTAESLKQKGTASRKEDLLMDLDLRKLHGVEIGPLDRPIVSRSESSVRYADHADTKSLRRKYSAHRRVNVDAIPDIDIVLSGNNLVDCVGRESLDYVVASHVIEHVPDFIGFLRDMHDVLRTGGVLCLAVPDHRYTFDVFRRPTFYEDMGAAHVAGVKRPSLDQVVEHYKNVVEFDLRLAWTNYRRALEAARLKHPRLNIPRLVEKYQSGEYLDVHCWIFSPWSFLRLTKKVCEKYSLLLGLRWFVPTSWMRSEFFVQFEKLASFEDWYARWPDHVMREPEAEQQANGAKHLRGELEAIKGSWSWRITAPLRAMYRGFQWLLRNTRRAFKLLGWLGTGQFTRAGRALLPYYQRYVPLRVQEMVPYRVRWAVTRRLRPTYGGYVPLFDGEPPSNVPVKLIAFYLPHFHQIPENDSFYKEGFTAWTSVQAAKPQFTGHYQPRIPGELGYYNLLDPEVQRRQVELAKLYGVGGFCFHFYWFNGRRPLEKPIENYLNNPQLDLPFCLCWANENWTRRWAGKEKKVLIAQDYSAEDDLAFIEYVSKYMRNPRYIRIDGRPLLIVYRPSLLPSARETARRWRKWCRNNGVGELYLAYTQSFERVAPATYDFDAAIEFPPNMEAESSELPNVNRSVKPLRRGFACNVLDWSDYIRRSCNYTHPGYKIFRAICPSWDNTARRKNAARILVNNSPAGYYEWLLNAITDTCSRSHNPDERLVFVNAWNEWGEGAYLEPDAGYGYAYLEATRLALLGAAYQPLSKQGSTWNQAYLQGRLQSTKAGPAVLLCAHSAGWEVFGGERSFIDILDAFHKFGVSVICTLPRTNNHNYIEELGKRSAGVYILPYQQWSPLPEDEAIIEKLIEIIQRHSVNIVYANTIMLREPLTAARRCGVITVTHAREIITYDPDLARGIGLPPDEIVRQVTSRSDYIIANSKATAECYKQSKSVMVVPNMVDIDQIDLANDVDPADVRFALVSSNLPKKGLSDVIELAKRCESSVPNARFLIIGPDNLYISALKKDQQKGRVPKNVEFSGYKNTPREAMAEGNVILHLSHFKESFGRTAIEGMATRRPVIAYDWGALSELIRDGETGFLVDFQNMDQLIDRVKTLCENPGLISEMGRRGRVFVNRYYSRERFVERLKDAYSNIVYEAHSQRKVCNLNLLRKAPPTAIIIPVYNAYEELQECMASVQEYINLAENRLIVIDDASDDARVRQFLEGVNNIELVCNEQNVGYTKTCNKGISLAAPYDVVLLNGDTIVTPRWLESLRIAAYSAAEIGTATALSDNAGAFSMPIPNQQNIKPDGIDYPDYARLMRQFCGGCEIPELPTGNGFCMFIKRKLIDEIGDFDVVAFPRGYGEENDFCMRALNAGWRNVMAPAAFVFHHRQASFGADKKQLLAEGMKVIEKRYPDYMQRVKDAFSSLAMESLRRAAQRAAAATRMQPVETRVAVLTRAGSPSNIEPDEVNRRFFVLLDADKIFLPQADAMPSSQDILIPVTQNFEQEFATWLLSYGIDRVEVDALSNLPFDLREVCDLLGIPHMFECSE